MGIAHGDGDEIVRSGYHLMGNVVGGVAAAGAQLTGSLQSVIEKLHSEGPRPLELRLGGGGDFRDSMLLGWREAGKRVERGLNELWLRSSDGARHGTLGLARGVTDGVGVLAVALVGATLQAGTQLISTIELVSRGERDHHLPHVRPARSFFGSPRLLPLSQCMMRSFSVSVHALVAPAVERGSVYIELSLHEPGLAAARMRRFSQRRTWLQGFCWQVSQV